MLEIEKLMEEKSYLIDKEFDKVLPKDGIKNLSDAVWYHMGTGGKRMRPLLSILTCEALGGDVNKILPFASACELFHNWILIHDDIEDSDKVRRNLPTVWVKYSIPHAINVGDYLEHKVFELILHSKEHGVDDATIIKLMKSMTTTAVKTAEGQTMEMNLRSNDSPTEKEYIEMVIGKTAHYLTVPMIGAAIVAGREDLINSLMEFGMNLGPAFQIADDILDLTEGKGRNEIGRDIKEGKRSVLVIDCLSKCNHDEKEKLINILNKTPEDTSDVDVHYAKNTFEKYGSVEYSKQLAERYTKNAKEVAGKMPEKLRDILLFFADYAVQRRK
jgi:geranylgeranyl pyrophosphate synthase